MTAHYDDHWHMSPEVITNGRRAWCVRLVVQRQAGSSVRLTHQRQAGSSASRRLISITPAHPHLTGSIQLVTQI